MKKWHVALVFDENSIYCFDAMGREFIISYVSLPLIIKYYYFVRPDNYIYRYEWDSANKKCRSLPLHRDLLPAAEMVDHIDRDRRNNTIDNLRIASFSENVFNRGLNKNNTTGYKGVAKYGTRGRYRAFIAHEYKQIHLGVFDKAVNAAKAYDAKALELFKEFAVLNFP